MNGWLLVRIAGIVVGIATLLRVATNEGLVTYDPLFLAWMDELRDVVELGIPLDKLEILLVKGIELVRTWGISVPDLQDEWRPAFVFSMLLLGAVARNSQYRGWLFAAPVGALVIAVWSGLIGNLALVGVAASCVPVLRFGSGRALALVALVVVGSGVGITAFGLDLVLIGAATVATFIALAAVLFMGIGIVKSWGGGLRGVFADANFNTGIDILAAMLGALFLASWFASPPIW